MDTATAFAPATVANVAVGFDILGFPLEGIGDRVTVRKVKRRSVEITEITGKAPLLQEAELKTLPRDRERNTATAGLVQMIQDFNLDFGMDVSIAKEIPIQSGMGGSAASAVAAVLAASCFLPNKLNKSELLQYALIGEKTASGSIHLDNIAPCLLGGLILSPYLRCLPFPKELVCVLIHPHLKIATEFARKILTPSISMGSFVKQSGNLAGFITGCFTGDLSLIQSSMKDEVIEPQREKLIPGFQQVKNAALGSGALACSISGAGPSVFAFAKEQSAEGVRNAMVKAFQEVGVGADFWISRMNDQGARVL